MIILVINAGSSSVKFCVKSISLSMTTSPSMTTASFIHGTVKEIGRAASLEIIEKGHVLFQSESQIDNHEQAFSWLFRSLNNLENQGQMSFTMNRIDAVGHRIVHGGERFVDTTVIDSHVLDDMRQLHELAPLHNPTSLEGIHAVKRLLGDSIPMVAVFDTTFHRTLPDHANTYAIPVELTKRHHIKRYGFHGIAHASLAHSYAKETKRDLSTQRLITLQLGHGCSMTAIANGKSLDTSMGLTPCEGLMMGTRSGDVDPSLVGYLSHKEQVSVIGVQSWLNEKSGLLGVSGRTSDMRSLIRMASQMGESQAQLAIDMFCYRIQKYLGAYWAILGGADAVIFGGGIGEHAPEIRAQICNGMKWSGLKLDTRHNQSIESINPGQVQLISQETSSVGVYVVGTDEETLIAEETVRSLTPCSQTEGRSE